MFPSSHRAARRSKYSPEPLTSATRTYNVPCVTQHRCQHIVHSSAMQSSQEVNLSEHRCSGPRVLERDRAISRHDRVRPPPRGLREPPIAGKEPIFLQKLERFNLIAHVLKLDATLDQPAFHDVPPELGCVHVWISILELRQELFRVLPINATDSAWSVRRCNDTTHLFRELAPDGLYRSVGQLVLPQVEPSRFGVLQGAFVSANSKSGVLAITSLAG